MAKYLIYGGRGALGNHTVGHFKAQKHWVASIDLAENPEADLNIVVNSSQDLEQQENKILDVLSENLKDSKLSGIICVAGGWTGGNAKKGLAKAADTMWNQSVGSSIICASIASRFLADDGLLVLTGAKAALNPTPGMIGYGLAKNAVHFLTKTLAEPNSGLPEKATIVAILPVTLDTPNNRKFMPKADFSTWTPLGFVSGLLLKWSQNIDRPTSGALVELLTVGGETELKLS